jgi:hypothetical protein
MENKKNDDLVVENALACPFCNSVINLDYNIKPDEYIPKTFNINILRIMIREPHFDDNNNKKIAFVEVYAAYCVSCKKIITIWDDQDSVFPFKHITRHWMTK